MRRGVPVVVTPEVGAAEIVRESGAGLVVAGEPEPLSSAIRLLIADPSLARSMGEAGQRHAARFTWDYVAMQMEDLYKSLKHPVHAFGAGALANARSNCPGSADV